VCELNQRGLHAAPHQHGVVMPEEHLIAAFQEWVKAQLVALAPPGATTAKSR